MYQLALHHSTVNAMDTVKGRTVKDAELIAFLLEVRLFVFMFVSFCMWGEMQTVHCGKPSKQLSCKGMQHVCTAWDARWADTALEM